VSLSMNEVRNRKEKMERKSPLGDINRVAMGRSPSSPVVETAVKRPSRACSSRQRLSNVSDGGASIVSSPTPPLPRTSSKVSNDYPFSAEPARPSASRTGVRAVSLALATSVSQERLELRSLWEMAAVMNFFCVFRHIINNLPAFTMDELESAILNPNSVLDTIHVVLLKGVPPAARIPLRGDTWPTVLSKKFKDWWWRVAEGPCPLIPCQGAELATYLELDAPTRVRVLLALCEMRVDQDDARMYIDDSVKRSQFSAVVRKDRSGCGAEGTTFWLEEDLLMGQRLYREGQATRPVPSSKNKGRGGGRGRNVPPPIPGTWETVATNFEEFQEVSTRLLESRNRLETAMGKKLMQSLLPELEEIQKKKDRMVKKQQREAVLLDNMLQGNGLAAGRSRRERKPVTYTFDEFDRSISEAIKFTKKNGMETSMRHGYGNGVNEVGGFGRERTGNAAHGQVGYVNGGGPGVRRSSRNSRSNLGPEFEGEARDTVLEPHLVEANLGFSDDEIEGEAVYDDDYLAARQRKGSYSWERGESLRGDADDADFDGDGESEKGGEESNEYGGNLNGGDSDRLRSEERVQKRPRRGPKVRLVNDISRKGARRKSFDSAAGGEDEGSDFDEQITIDAQQRLQRVEGGRAESSALGVGHNRRDSGFEASDSHEASGYSSEMRNRKVRGLAEGKRKTGRVSSMDDAVESIDYSREQLVKRSARSEDEEQQEAGSVDFDEEGGTGQEVEDWEGSGRRRQLLDLNEVATARGSSPLSENGESEYSQHEPERGAEAG
jgi:hypothetical protein